jgi:ppGpp synthetase/RelA/SpoT-type nucleotidyltranferase
MAEEKTLLPEDDEVSRTWNERPDVIRQFIEVRPQYEQLCSEIAYILKKRMDNSGIEYSALTSRPKTLKSLAEKLSRKHYESPLNEITDLAGVRLVFLYKSDRPQIEDIIESEFEILEKVDKVEEHEPDRFGYGALHYLVHLGRKSSGARYDDLKKMVCEIQVRTVLQDAWAIIDHHLIYKQERDVPNILKRKLNSLSGLFETADDQFERIRAEREVYRDKVKSKLTTKGKFIDQELNLDTLWELLRVRFPDKPVVKNVLSLSRILSAAESLGFDNLSDIDGLLRHTKKARDFMGEKLLAASGAAETIRAITLVHPEAITFFKLKSSTTKLLNQGRDLLVSSKD